MFSLGKCSLKGYCTTFYNPRKPLNVYLLGLHKKKYCSLKSRFLPKCTSQMFMFKVKIQYILLNGRTGWFKKHWTFKEMSLKPPNFFIFIQQLYVSIFFKVSYLFKDKFSFKNYINSIFRQCPKGQKQFLRSWHHSLPNSPCSHAR